MQWGVFRLRSLTQQAARGGGTRKGEGRRGADYSHSQLRCLAGPASWKTATATEGLQGRCWPAAVNVTERDVGAALEAGSCEPYCGSISTCPAVTARRFAARRLLLSQRPTCMHAQDAGTLKAVGQTGRHQLGCDNAGSIGSAGDREAGEGGEAGMGLPLARNAISAGADPSQGSAVVGTGAARTSVVTTRLAA